MVTLDPIEAAYRKGHSDGRIGASAYDEDDGWKEAQRSLSAPPALPVAWQRGEQELALRWMTVLLAKLGSKPDHADDCLWLVRLHALLSSPANGG